MAKTALVTGGNRGIGHAVVAGLSEKYGLKVLLGSRDLGKGEKAAQGIQGQVSPVRLDLSNHTLRQRQMESILEAHGPVDILINNAAILEYGDVLGVSEEAFRKSVEVNFLAAFDLVRVVVPDMILGGYGRIVNVSSRWGSFEGGLTGPAAYSITKAALNALTLSLSQELPDYIKVNAVSPGWTRTDMGGAEATRSPEEATETILWLASLAEDGPTGGFFRDKQPISW